MKIIVGLGNPGRAYSQNRHNVGFMTVDLLGSRHSIDVKKRSFGSFVGSGVIEGEAVILAKPQTFMNVSGEAVNPLVGYYKLEPKDLIVIHDDVDIEVGKLKIAFDAGHGGHNGVRSIIEEIGSGSFYRVRIGVGRPPGNMDTADYVLSDFVAGEEKAVDDLINKAADATQILISQGIAAAQQKYHS